LEDFIRLYRAFYTVRTSVTLPEEEPWQQKLVQDFITKNLEKLNHDSVTTLLSVYATLYRVNDPILSKLIENVKSNFQNYKSVSNLLLVNWSLAILGKYEENMINHLVNSIKLNDSIFNKIKFVIVGC
jgi:hypothetical protein